MGPVGLPVDVVGAVVEPIDVVGHSRERVVDLALQLPVPGQMLGRPPSSRSVQGDRSRIAGVVRRLCETAKYYQRCHHENGNESFPAGAGRTRSATWGATRVSHYLTVVPVLACVDRFIRLRDGTN